MRTPVFVVFFFCCSPFVFVSPSPSSDALPSSQHRNDAINKPDTGSYSTSNDSIRLLSNSSPSSATDQEELLCADGKGPLLEGEERIFPCAGECPGGFDCEFPLGRQKGGICCPNLSELFQLYKEKSEEEGEDGTENREETEEGQRKREQQQKSRKEGKKRVRPKEMGAVDAMALLEQHYGDGIARVRPNAPRPTTQWTAAPPRAFDENVLVSSHTVEVRRSQPKYHQTAQQQDFVGRLWQQKAAKTESKPRNMDISGEEYSCRRQKLELFCDDRRRQTQFVLRWYAKDRVCVSYPWGYCSGKPVASDPTIRTREECEMLCTADRLSTANRNVVHFWEERKNARRGRGKSDTNAGSNESGTTTPLDLSNPDDAIDIVPTTSIDEKSAENVSAGGEAPFAAASGAHVEASSVHETNPTASSAEFSDFLLMDQQRHHPKKRCVKMSPYRSMCPDGMPSQFTLRWHFHESACFAYPYGYCHGESVMAEEPIKTEQECLRICATMEGRSQQRTAAEGPLFGRQRK